MALIEHDAMMATPAAGLRAPRRTQAERREESEAALLVAAATLIEREGFAAVTFERVGALAGYSRGLAAHHFGSKDGLVRAVIAFISDRVQSHVDAAAAGEATVAGQILAWTDALLAVLDEDPLFRAYFVMLNAANGNRAADRSIFLERHELVRERLRDAIERGIRAGEISADVDADATALAIGSLQLGIATELLLDPALDIDVMRRTARRAVSGLLGTA